MIGNRKIILWALLLAWPGSASAQTALEQQLAGALEARNDKLDLDTTKLKSEWKLAQQGKVAGKGCSITYYSGTGGQAMAYVGPTADWDEAFFSGQRRFGSSGRRADAEENHAVDRR